MSSEPTQSCSVCFVPKKRRLRYLFRETREVLLNVEIEAESMAKRRTVLSERRKDVFGVRRFDPSFQRFRERDGGARQLLLLRLTDKRIKPVDGEANWIFRPVQLSGA